LKNNKKIIIYGKNLKKNTQDIFVEEKDFKNPPADYQSTIIGVRELNRIENISLFGKSIPELFDYKGISFWWFFYQYLARSFITSAYFINNFSKFIEAENPDTVKVENDFRVIEIIKQICERNNVELIYSKGKYSKFVIYNKMKKNLRKSKARLLLKKKIKTRKDIFFKKRKSIPSTNDKLIFYGHPVFRRPIFNSKKGKMENGEYIIQNLINLLNEKEKVVGLDFFSLISSDNQVLIERLNSEIDWFPLDVILENDKLSSHKNYLKKYNKIINSLEFKNQFKYNGISFWDLIKNDFNEFNLPSFLAYYMLVIDSMKNYFLTNKPKAVFLIYETGPLSLATIGVCNQLGIKTIGIQHGLMYNYNYHYMHENFQNLKNPSGFILPDKLLLFGEISKKILLSHGYPEDRLIVLGNPAFFDLEKMVSSMSKKSILSQYSLPNCDNFVLFLPPGMSATRESKLEYNETILKNLLQKFGGRTDLFFIVKPHPSDKVSIYEKIISKSQFTNVKIIQGNLFELIFLSSIVISTFSTTMMDALCLKKPVIQVIFAGSKVQIPFDEYDAVFQTSLENLEHTITKLLHDKTLIKSSINNATKFIKKYYNIPPENPKLVLKNILEDKY
jgi:CDP-glycerol glycerophosphotransferase (TagB/SpsB family)